ncbi:MAG: hypothetical protein GY722_23670 [bacterium]|nr:hypothetical protein [bacterium]
MTEETASAERVKCRLCDRMPLVATAEAKDGLCGVCFKDKKHRELHRELQEARRPYLLNPPKTQEEVDELAPPDDIDSLALRTFLVTIRPPLLPPGRVRKQDFLDEVSKLATKYSSSPERAADEFMHLCEPILEGTWARKSRLRRIPRPFRELYALLCAWGTVGSDGFYCYLDTYKKWWDAEADKGLAFLGLHEGRGVLKRARRVLRWRGIDLLGQMDNEMWEQFYTPIEHYDTEILGRYLVDNFSR